MEKGKEIVVPREEGRHGLDVDSFSLCCSQCPILKPMITAAEHSSMKRVADTETGKTWVTWIEGGGRSGSPKKVEGWGLWRFYKWQRSMHQMLTESQHMAGPEGSWRGGAQVSLNSFIGTASVISNQCCSSSLIPNVTLSHENSKPALVQTSLSSGTFCYTTLG